MKIAEIDATLRERQRTHGHPVMSHNNIAAYWNAYLGNRGDPDEALEAWEVALMMALLKIARTQSGEFNRDDLIDLCGYSALALRIHDQSTGYSDNDPLTATLNDPSIASAPIRVVYAGGCTDVIS